MTAHSSKLSPPCVANRASRATSGRIWRHWFSLMGTAKFRGFVGKLGWLMLDSRVVDLRILYTDGIPFPTSCQESNIAGQYQEFEMNAPSAVCCHATSPQCDRKTSPHSAALFEGPLFPGA